MRAYQGHLASRQAMSTFSSPGPIMPTRARMSTSLGNDIHTSQKRMMSASTLPRAAAAAPPAIMPTPAVTIIVRSAVTKVVRMPQIMRESMSRPRRSVPKGCSRLGGRNFDEMSMAVGSASGSRGAARPAASTARRKRPDGAASALRQRFVMPPPLRRLCGRADQALPAQGPKAD